MRDLDQVFDALATSAFRRRFKLAGREREYLLAKGMDTVVAHAHALIAARIGSANPAKDGKQTPFCGHPVFVAQHATGTCCRTCLAKWHDIAKGKALTVAQENHVVQAIERWLRQQIDGTDVAAQQYF